MMRVTAKIYIFSTMVAIRKGKEDGVDGFAGCSVSCIVAMESKYVKVWPQPIGT